MKSKLYKNYLGGNVKEMKKKGLGKRIGAILLCLLMMIDVVYVSKVDAHAEGKLTVCNGEEENHVHNYIISSIALSPYVHYHTVICECGAEGPDNGYECNTDGENGACSVCGYKAEHTHIKGTEHEAKAATCTEAGTKEYWDCTGCDAKLDSEGNVLESIVDTEATGHDWSDGNGICKNDANHVCSHPNVEDGKCTTCGNVNIIFKALEGGPDGIGTGEDYTKILDGEIITKWCCNTYLKDVYVIIKANASVKVSGYIITTANDTANNPGRNPKAWTLSACNDYNETTKTGSWKIIDTVLNGSMPAANYKSKAFDISENDVAYQYYRLDIKEIVGDNFEFQISEFKLLNSVCNHNNATTGTCSLCGKHLTHEKGTAHEAVAATCTEPATVVCYECSGCNRLLDEDGNTIVDITTGVALGHDWDSETGICKRDSKHICDHETVEDGKCTVCNKNCNISIIDAAPYGEVDIENCYKIIDGRNDTKWCAKIKTYPAYVVIKLEKPITASGYVITTADDNSKYSNRTPKKWVLYGCNDYEEAIKNNKNPSWEIIDSVTNYSFETRDNVSETFNISEPKSYKYYKWSITALRGLESGISLLQVAEFKLLDSNCTHRGITTGECPDCGRELSHLAKIHYSAYAPTCTTNGGIAYDVCKICGKKIDEKGNIITYSTSIPALGHDWSDKNGICKNNSSHTCSHSNQTVGVCTICGKELSHVKGEYHAEKSATCTESGNIAYFNCKNCSVILNEAGEVITSYINGEAIGHDFSVQDKTRTAAKISDATCTEGSKYYKGCSRCEAVSTQEEDIFIEGEGLGHLDEDENGICDRCTTELFKNGLSIADIDDQIYTGKAIIPQLKVMDRNVELVLNRDYTVRVTKNINVGTATVTITGKGNYDKVETAEFNIVAADISGSDFTADAIGLKETGRDQKPKPVLKWNGKAVAATNYTYQYFKSDEDGNITGEALNSIKDAGVYAIVITAKENGNFTGVRNEYVEIVDNTKTLVSSLSVSAIKAQTYTGMGVEPEIVVKSGKKVLTKSEDGITGDYIASYGNNVCVGTAYVVIIGINDYVGAKKVTFKINGTPVTKATVEGVTAVMPYTGNDITFDGIKLYIKPTKTTEQINLTEGKDYEVSYSNNQKAGVATVTFTGKNGYTGVIKKTFRITPAKLTDSQDKFSLDFVDRNIAINDNFVNYCKGGTKPAVKVTFTNEDGTERVLEEKTDYTVAYINNTAVNDGSNEKKLPTVKITLKGSYSGVMTKNFKINAKDIEYITAEAADKTYVNKPGAYKSAVKLIDTDGKVLVANRDYNAAVEYAVFRDGQKVVLTNKDIVEAGELVTATVFAKSGSNYKGGKSCTYRVTKSAISSAKVVKIDAQIYTGKAIELEEKDIVIRQTAVSEPLIPGEDYVIVPGSYTNNVNKGTASVIIRGKNNYGGTRKVTFTIKAKSFKWWNR